jgi:ABC-type transporter Mla subunit MlaD
MPDNIESRMSFIIEQQAQFTVDIQLLKERQAETREMIRQLVDVTMSLARHGEETDRRLRELAEAGAHTDERLRQLAEAGTHTDRRLDALIDTVDRLVRRNGS